MKKLTSTMALLFVLVLAGFSFTSCSKKVEQPAIPVQESTNSTPYGTVWLVDKYGELSSNNSGVKVTLTGNNVNVSVLSGVDGRFQFKDVPEGKYLLQFSKDGFATSEQTTTVKGYFYTGSAILGPIATHDIFITDATLAFNKIVMQMSAIPAPAKFKHTGYMVFASNNPDVSAGNATYSVSYRSENITEQYLDVDQLVKAGININAPIYLALYPNTFNVTKSNVDGVITYPALKLEGKKLMTVNK